MSSIISLEGLTTVGNNEDRALAYIKVEYNGNVYLWQIYIPKDVVNLELFLEDSKSKIEFEIDTKEQEWLLLNPKTRIIQDPITGENITVEIQKDEIVKANIPDYYALRRSEYPSIGEQLDAVWKGSNSQAYIDMLKKIQDIKNKYPKPL